MKLGKLFELIVSTIILFDILIYSEVKADDSWMNPASWSENFDCCKCPESSLVSAADIEKSGDTNVPRYTEDGVALMYLKRFLIQLFDRKKLAHDDKLNIYKRSLTLSLSSLHLQKLEKLNDPRDLDEIITEIFATAKMASEGQICSTQKETGFIALVVDIFIDLLQLTKINEIRFLLLAILVVICAWFLHRRYNISYLTQGSVALLVVGYIHTYLECNRELEINEMKEALKLSEQSSPSIFMRFLNSFSSWNSADEHHNQLLMKSTKLKLGICRPDHVAIMYFNDMFMKYVEVMVKQSLGTLSLLQNSLRFPFNWLAGVMLFGLIAFLLKLTFQYILSPASWSYNWQTRNNNRNAIHQDSEHTDRISGENLNKLLTVLGATVEGIKNQPLPAVSGVQDIREGIEYAPENDVSLNSTPTKDTSKASNSIKIKNNNESPPKETNSNLSDVKMADLSDDA